MRVIISRVAASGHVVVVRLPEGAGFVGRYIDDGSVRDLTTFTADLLLTGALDVAENAETARPDPAEDVEAVEVSYVTGPVPPGQTVPPASFTWMHLPSGEAGDFPPADVVATLARGVGVELTSAAAAEAADDIPDSPQTLTDPTE